MTPPLKGQLRGDVINGQNMKTESWRGDVINVQNFGQSRGGTLLTPKFGRVGNQSDAIWYLIWRLNFSGALRAQKSKIPLVKSHLKPPKSQNFRAFGAMMSHVPAIPRSPRERGDVINRQNPRFESLRGDVINYQKISQSGRGVLIEGGVIIPNWVVVCRGPPPLRMQNFELKWRI